MESNKLTIKEARALIDSNRISVLELVKDTVQRINKTENSIGAFITLDIENAIEKARAIDKLIEQNALLSNLAGIPFGVQDNICTLDLRTTAGSKILDSFVPPYDATVIQKLKGCHSIILGKLNMDEFGLGTSTENATFGSTKNPRDISKVPGGGAGGGAAAVASDMIFFAIGSDGSGDLRQPAAFCGVVGFKPTKGLVSRFGQVAFASSMEQIGCITKSVIDCSYVLDKIAFYDEKDSISIKRDTIDYNNDLIDEVKGLKIGIPKEIFGESWDPRVRSSINAAIKTFEQLGVEFIEISLPHIKYASGAHLIISSCEASSNLGRYDGIKYGLSEGSYDDLESIYRSTRSQGFGDEVKRRILLGSLFLTSKYYNSYYKKALGVRSLLVEDFRKAYKKCRLILTPTSPILAYDRVTGQSKATGIGDSHRYTLLANMTGLPAISIPCGFSGEGLPIGLQLMGDYFCEGTLIRSAYSFEYNTDYHIKRAMQLEVAE